MIKVSVLYPNTRHARFDMAYYCDKHIPMVMKRLGAACKRVEVERALQAIQPGPEPEFMVTAEFLFESVAAFQQAFGAHAAAIMGDIPNYTDLTPIIQVGELKIGG